MKIIVTTLMVEEVIFAVSIIKEREKLGNKLSILAAIIMLTAYILTSISMTLIFFPSTIAKSFIKNNSEIMTSVFTYISGLYFL